jgi:ribosomal protein S6--L-glutamate ligase
MIISFFPGFKGDYNFFQFEPLDEKIFSLLSQARAVIFPPTISPEIYFWVKNLGIPVFPEYTFRFFYPGKIGQIMLLKLLNLPHPETIIIPRLCGLEENPYKRTPKIKFPCVIKGNYGDEGKEVFLVNNEEEFRDILKIIKGWERENRFGFLIQEYIPCDFDARAIVIGKKIFIFFRKGGFKKNIVQEGKIIPCPKRGLKEKVLDLTHKIIKNTYFNLVAIDFLFKEENPLVSEFNFVFGRRAIGEKKYEFYLKKAIKDFLKNIN